MAVNQLAMELDDLIGKGFDPTALDAEPLDFADLDDLELPLSPTGVANHVSSGPTSAGGGNSSGASGNAAGSAGPASGGASRRRGAAASPGSNMQDLAAAEAADKEAASKERIRAKNRRAQARYREKQKAKKAETEEAVQRAAEEMERLKMENAAMVQRNDVMESFLAVRDHSAEVLDHSAQLEAAKMQPAAQAALARLRAVAPDMDPESAWKVVEVDADGKEIASAIEEENATPEPPCPFLTASYSEIKNMLRAATHDGIKVKHRAICDTLGDVLSQLDDPRSSDVVKKSALESMEQALWEAGCMCFETAVASPNTMHKILAGSVGEGVVVHTPEEVARWTAITAKLELTQEQRQKLLPLRDLFLARAARIAGNRRRILASLAAAVPEEPAEGDGMASLAALQETTRNWLALHQATQELEENLMEEHVAVMELLARSFGGVLTPLQKARALVVSHPNFPDMFAIATVVAAQDAVALPATA